MAVRQLRPGRIPPHNLEAEESVLGACLLSRDAVGSVVELVEPADFYRPVHREMFAAMLDLYARGDPTDAVAYAEELRRRDLLDRVGGRPYLATIVGSCPTAGSAPHYARIIAEHGRLRRLAEAGMAVSDLAFSLPGDVEGACDQAEEMLFAATASRSKSEPRSLGHILAGQVHMLDAGRSGITGTASGFADLDSLLGGLIASNLIVLGGRPSMGKTALALDIARQVAKQGVSVAVFSLEMSRSEVGQRMLGAEAGVSHDRLRKGTLHEAEIRKVSDALSALADLPIVIDDDPSATVLAIRARCRRLHAKAPLGLIVVDYLQLVGAGRRMENRTQEVSEISRSLKVLAREFEVPVVACSQLSRSVEGREDKRPRLSDLRDSGGIEQDADVVLFIYRDEVYHPSSTDRGIAELSVVKHRNGPTGRVSLAWRAGSCTFADLARRP